MAIYQASVTVGTSATELKTGETAVSGRTALMLFNASASEVFLGGATVTVTGGFPLPSGRITTVPTAMVSSSLYGVANTGPVPTVRVLESD